MAIRARIRRHPHITAMATFVVVLLLWGWLLPWVWHQPRDWAKAISMSLVLGLLVYFNRIRSERVKAFVLAAISVGALIVYASVVRAHGFPQDTTERFYFAGVVAIPVLGIALAFWMVLKRRVLT